MRSMVFAVACLIPASLLADDPPRLVFPNAGYSIEGLDDELPDQPFQSVILFAPATQGFAPNVNVRVQPFAGTVDEYVAANLKDLEKNDLELIGEPKVEENVVILEFQGSLQGRDLRFYSRSLLNDGRVVLVTATATKEQWETAGPKLRKCADSLKREAPPAKPAAE